MQKPLAILFDCDGTLFSSLDVICESVNHCLALQGVEPISRDTVRRLSGMPLHEIDAYLAPVVDVEKFNADYWAREREHHTSEHMLLVQEVAPLLELCREHGLKMGVVTTREHGSAADLLSGHNLLEYFGVVVGRDDVEHPKPHPEPVHHACDALGVDPHDCLFVGDSPNDFRAAKDAGCTFVGVLTGAADRDEFEKMKADYIFEHAGELADLVRKVVD